MSAKTKVSPIKVRDKPQRKTEFPNLNLGVFRWILETGFANITTGERAIKSEVWRLSSAVALHGLMVSGRKRMLERMRWDYVFGASALALALSGRFPCSTEQAEELIKQARKMQLKFAFICLESDLYPTDEETYAKMGLKNKWVVIRDYPDRDTMNRKLNAQLKKSGSPLRVLSGLRTIITDR